MKRLSFVLGVSLILCLVASWVAAGADNLILPGTTERVSLSSEGVEGNNFSLFPSISADGRYVAFYSEADNLVPDDWNGIGDVFVYDRQTDSMERITGWGGGGTPQISANGRYVVFTSDDSNLVPGDTNGAIDVFVYDRETGTMERANVTSDGQEGNGYGHYPFISADGNYVTFISWATNLSPIYNQGWPQIFVRDRQLGLTEMVSLNADGEAGIGGYGYITISSDGRFLAFTSSATNLVEGDTTLADDIFLRDRQTGMNTRITVSPSGEEANDDSYLSVISGNGQYIVYTSTADNLVPGDSNNRGDTLVYDRLTGENKFVSVNSYGQQADLAGIYPAISADGRYVTFASGATNLGGGIATDIFLHDRQTGVTEVVSVDSAFQPANYGSTYSAISDDGRTIAFESSADNLVSGDTNNTWDIFVRERLPISLTINYGDGAPGSFFTLTGTNFPLTNTAVISVNGYLLGTVPTDSSGNFTILLSTTDADLGAYFVTVAVAPYEATARFVLEVDGEVRPQEGKGPIFNVPAGIAHRLYFMPLVQR